MPALQRPHVVFSVCDRAAAGASVRIQGRTAGSRASGHLKVREHQPTDTELPGPELQTRTDESPGEEEEQSRDVLNDLISQRGGA